ncbi:TraV family lipoprotein [Sphingobium phenoxybenzoativorans]|jgi:conjugal transfer pilus assembly protein TraV|uniref:TraV family lipoprotein n=1 Tax=Sphingobium phenoxybenzoativorans TaxID=1592790 RepID=A0A975KA91_9SPHN|nr:MULTISPECIES: TraV family lipoprotein [Sphingobium]QUT07679.1 TraV family lipoprotein [Sphingobium phenoxybenzoativorans]
MEHPPVVRPRLSRLLPLTLVAAALPLGGCATVGSLMSPYSEKFSCKNSDHGQCIHPEKAYEDAVAGRSPRSDPAVTRDKKLLRGSNATAADATTAATHGKAYGTYRDSVYRELQGLIDQPVTPMLKPSQAVRTLILPYADRQRPDRLYMPRYVYSILERPSWVVGGYLVEPVLPASQLPVLGQLREKSADSIDPAPAPLAPSVATPLPRKEPRR